MNNSMKTEKSIGKQVRLFTSHSPEIPGELSYQNIKLANFIELELTDLCDTLQ